MKKAEYKTAVCLYKACPRKGAPFVQNLRGRPKKFCSQACQLAQWHELHPRMDLTGAGAAVLLIVLLFAGVARAGDPSRASCPAFTYYTGKTLCGQAICDVTTLVCAMAKKPARGETVPTVCSCIPASARQHPCLMQPCKGDER